MLKKTSWLYSLKYLQDRKSNVHIDTNGKYDTAFIELEMNTFDMIEVIYGAGAKMAYRWSFQAPNLVMQLTPQRANNSDCTE